MGYPKEVEEFIKNNIQDRPTDLARKVLRTFPNFIVKESNLRRTISNRKAKILGAIKDHSTKHGVDSKNVSALWIKDKESSILVRNPELSEDFQAKFKDELLESIKDHSPNYVSIIREKSKDGHLLVLDPADIHIGKLCDSFESGEDYNNEIAVQRVLDGVDGIIQKSNGFNIDKILFIGGNDILHIDTPDRKTTSGTSQDTCGMWYTNFLKAKKLYVDLIDKLINIADVHFTFNPSNHDYVHGFFLAQVIETHYANCDNITFDCSIAHRKGFKYGSNLIGTTHGDGAKAQDLPLLMAQEFPKWWGKTKHRYVYTHHVHHKTSKDYIGVTVESLRSPSATDSWHHRKGFQHSPQAVEGFIHHKDFGQIARLTHIF